MKKLAAFCFVCIILSPLVSLAQKPITINGVVNDNKGGPLAGASIQIRGKSSGTTSDNEGLFRIRLQPGMFICINAVGFQGDTIKIEDTTTRLAIMLQPRIKSLEGIVITGTDQKAVTNDPTHIMVTHSAGATLNEFVQSEMSFNGMTLVTPYSLTPSGMPNVHDGSQAYITSTPANTFYRMSSLPAFSIKEDTKGNRYLLADRWGQGVVITRTDSLVDNKALKFNFDKIQQNLYTTRDMNTIIELVNTR